jgi:hypothetical protein
LEQGIDLRLRLLFTQFHPGLPQRRRADVAGQTHLKFPAATTLQPLRYGFVSGELEKLVED